MKAWEQKIVPVVFALSGVLFLVPAVKTIIKGQPLNLTYLGLAMACLFLGVILWRKSGDGSGPPSG